MRSEVIIIVLEQGERLIPYLLRSSTLFDPPLPLCAHSLMAGAKPHELMRTSEQWTVIDTCILRICDGQTCAGSSYGTFVMISSAKFCDVWKKSEAHDSLGSSESASKH